MRLFSKAGWDWVLPMTDQFGIHERQSLHSHPKSEIKIQTSRLDFGFWFGAVWIFGFWIGGVRILDFRLGPFVFGSLMFGGRIEQHVWILHQIFLTHADSGRRTLVEFSKNNRWIVCCKDVVFLHVFHYFHCSLFCSPQSNYLSERDHQPAGI